MLRTGRALQTLVGFGLIQLRLLAPLSLYFLGQTHLPSSVIMLPSLEIFGSPWKGKLNWVQFVFPLPSLCNQK